MHGTIVKLGNGFGFIRSEGIPEDILFHVSDLVRSKFTDLKIGDTVSFEFDGLGAKKVTVVS